MKGVKFAPGILVPKLRFLHSQMNGRAKQQATRCENQSSNFKAGWILHCPDCIDESESYLTFLEPPD